MCESCRKKRRERKARLEKKRKEEGLCKACGKALDRDGAVCKRCLIKTRFKDDTDTIHCIECGDEYIKKDLRCDATCPSCIDSLLCIDYFVNKHFIHELGGVCDCCGCEQTEFLHAVPADLAAQTIRDRSFDLDLGWYGCLDDFGYPYSYYLDEMPPESLIVRCTNCLLANHIYGYCPHNIQAAIEFGKAPIKLKIALKRIQSIQKRKPHKRFLTYLTKSLQEVAQRNEELDVTQG